MAYFQLGDQEFPLKSGSQRVGPDGDAQLRLPSGDSAATALILVNPDQSVVIQKASPDSVVKVNGVALGAEPSPLIHGDRVEIGAHQLRFGDTKQTGSTQFLSSAVLADAVKARMGAPAKPTTATGGRLVSLVDGREYTVADTGLIIGRDPSADVVVATTEVSRRHIQIAPAAQGYLLTDLSTNGVLVNGVRVSQQQVLGRGDVIKIATEEFRFYADTAKPAAAAGASPASPGSVSASPPPLPDPPPAFVPTMPPADLTVPIQGLRQAAAPPAPAPPARPAAPPPSSLVATTPPVPTPQGAPPAPTAPARPATPLAPPPATKPPTAPTPTPPAGAKPSPQPPPSAPSVPPAGTQSPPAGKPASPPPTATPSPVVAAAETPSTRPSHGRPALAVLEVLNEAEKGKKHEVFGPLTNIGRGAHNDIVIANDSVSDSHAKLQKREAGWYIVDIESTNGTYVGGRRVKGEQMLEGAPDLRFGDVKLSFRPNVVSGDTDKSTRAIAGVSLEEARRMSIRRSTAMSQSAGAAPPSSPPSSLAPAPTAPGTTASRAAPAPARAEKVSGAPGTEKRGGVPAWVWAVAALVAVGAIGFALFGGS